MNNVGNHDQVIVHWPQDASGSFRCDNWGPLPFPRPAMISIVPTSTSSQAIRYAQELATGLFGAFWRMSPSVQCIVCNGPAPLRCRGHGQSASSCVLALVGDGGVLNDYSGAVGHWTSLLAKDPRYRVVPICPPSGRSSMVAALPAGLRDLNIFEWTRTPVDAASRVLGAADLISRDYRVFISYRQEDGQDNADDIFGALAYAGFDVFLDRVRIGAGTHIPDRIREELAHKAIVLVLETPLASKSAWVAQEVAIAASNRLGILAVHFPGGAQIASLSSRRRYVLKPLEYDQSSNRLTKSGIDEICRRVADLHTFWLVRKHYQIQRALSNTLLYRGLTNHRITANSCLDVVPVWSPKTVCSIKTSPRMAALEDFRDLDNSAALADSWRRAVLGPGAFAAGERQMNMRWLSDKLKAGLFDESEMKRVADLLAGPRATELR